MSNLKRALIFSALLHIAFGVFAWLDFGWRNPEPLIRHGAVEVSLAPVLPQKPKSKPEPEPKPAPKPVPEPKPEPKPAPIPVREPKPEPKPAPIPAPKPAPKTPITGIIKAPEPPRKTKQNNTQSLLNSIIEEADQQPKTVEKESNKDEKSENTEQILTNILDETTPESSEESVQQSLTADDFNGLRAQLAQCWNIPAGAVAAENLRIQVRVFANPDGTVKAASLITDSGQSNNSYYNIAAESALRAVRDPKCNPLRLPLEKYALWQDMILVFDPREMF